MEFEAKLDEEDHAWHRADGQRAKANASGEPYNPINHDMQDNERGDGMIAHEKATRERAQLRAQNLKSRGNGSFNPITGL
jgi:hypothetical protein